MARRFRGYNEVTEPVGRQLLDQVLEQRRRLDARLARIGRIVAVASGKGGVGKSAITANLAAALAARGRRVGVLDADLNGPSIALMLGATEQPLRLTSAGVLPAQSGTGVALVSMALLLPASDAPLRWKGPENDGHLWRGALETGALREFLADIVWDELDYLFIDVPPGTDRIERLLELVPAPASILLVTTPTPASALVVARSARLLMDAGIPDVRLIVNMSGSRCPHCGGVLEVASPAASAVAEIDLDPWGEIPYDASMPLTTDRGTPIVLAAPTRPAAIALADLAARLDEGSEP